MVVDPTLELNGEESNILSSYFDISSENESNEFISNIVLTLILKSWEESKTYLHPSSTVMFPL